MFLRGCKKKLLIFKHADFFVQAGYFLRLAPFEIPKNLAIRVPEPVLMERKASVRVMIPNELI